MLSQALRSKSALTRVIATTALPAASLTVAAKASGFRVETIRAGDGKNFPKPGNRVTVHYTGWLNEPNGKKFDSSVDRKQPFVFTVGVGQVIRGWDEGLQKMSVGEKSYVYCPPDYGYGARGAPPVIPPNSTLCFEVELLKIN